MIVMGLYAVCEQKLAHHDRVLSRWVKHLVWSLDPAWPNHCVRTNIVPCTHRSPVVWFCCRCCTTILSGDSLRFGLSDAGLWHDCVLCIGTLWVPTARRLTLTGIDPCPSAGALFCLVALYTWCKKLEDLLKSLRWPAPTRCGTLTVVLLGWLHDSVYLTFVVPEYVWYWGAD